MMKHTHGARSIITDDETRFVYFMSTSDDLFVFEQ